jgi:hypothetical protein
MRNVTVYSVIVSALKNWREDAKAISKQVKTQVITVIESIWKLKTNLVSSTGPKQGSLQIFLSPRKHCNCPDLFVGVGAWGGEFFYLDLVHPSPTSLPPHLEGQNGGYVHPFW